MDPKRVRGARAGETETSGIELLLSATGSIGGSGDVLPLLGAGAECVELTEWSLPWWEAAYRVDLRRLKARTARWRTSWSTTAKYISMNVDWRSSGDAAFRSAKLGRGLGPISVLLVVRVVLVVDHAHYLLEMLAEHQVGQLARYLVVEVLVALVECSVQGPERRGIL